jgi:DNA polymerase-3 subunit gamma/tau
MEKFPLHLKYRPQNFEEIIGNVSLIESLKTVLDKDSCLSTFLFQGPSGSGKTTIARIIAKEVGARAQDIKELNIADTRGIDAARAIIENARFMPFGGRAKVYILDETHKSTADFQNALLKILEEPPKNTYFILCTTEPEKLLKTVRNRCTIYQVRLLRRTELIKLIKRVLVEEKRRKFPKEAVEQIAIAAEGCPRQTLVILDSVIDMKDDEKLLSAINDFSIHKEEVIELCRALLQKKSWKDISKIIKGIEEEPENVRYAVLGYLSSVLLSGKQSDRAFLIIEEFKEPFMYTKKAGLVSACYSVVNM